MSSTRTTSQTRGPESGSSRQVDLSMSADGLHPLRDVVDDPLIDGSRLEVFLRNGLAFALLEQVVQVGIEVERGVGPAAESGAEAVEVGLGHLVIAAALKDKDRNTLEGCRRSEPGRPPATTSSTSPALP